MKCSKNSPASHLHNFSVKILQLFSQIFIGNIDAPRQTFVNHEFYLLFIIANLGPS